MMSETGIEGAARSRLLEQGSVMVEFGTFSTDRGWEGPDVWQCANGPNSIHNPL